MKIGLVTDSLAHLPLEELLPTAAGLGITIVEFGCGNWSPEPHLRLDTLLASAAERADFLATLDALGLSISALNCSGNPLLPGAAGEAHRVVTSKAIQLAGLLGVRRVVMMSGCPGGPGDENANWVTTTWPPAAARALDWQWAERLIPYWRGLVAEAAVAGVERLCLELHGQQHVFKESMRICGVVTLRPAQRWHRCRWRGRDTSVRREAAAYRRGRAFASATAGAPRAASTASADAWQTFADDSVHRGFGQA
jgi:sugar phosphate isomerase/epimerase